MAFPTTEDIRRIKDAYLDAKLGYFETRKALLDQGFTVDTAVSQMALWSEENRKKFLQRSGN